MPIVEPIIELYWVQRKMLSIVLCGPHLPVIGVKHDEKFN